MFKIIACLVIVGILMLQASAQCGGYFRETNRQALSNSIVDGFFEDFDNDGLDDLLGFAPTQMSQSAPVAYQLHYYKRTGANSFDPAAQSSALTNVFFGNVFVVIGDVNGDGKKDLTVKHRTAPPTLTTYLNDGTGKFSTTTPAINFENETPWAAGDLNGDGKADLISTAAGTLYYRLVQPDDSFGARVAVGALNGTPNFGRNVFGFNSYLFIFHYPLIVEDLNNDGLKDIAYAASGGGASEYNLTVLTNNGNLSFTQTASTPFGPVTKLRTVDFGNDGKKDFISDNWSSNGVRIAVNNGSNGFMTSWATLPNITTNYGDSYYNKTFSAGDFDNDGDIDIIYPGFNSYAFLRNQGNQTFVAQQIGGLPLIDEVTNLDNDGRMDAVYLSSPFIDGIYSLSDGNNNFWFLKRNAVSFRKNVCTPAGQTKFIDFNGDGEVDRAFWNPATGIWRYYSNNNPQINNPSQTTFLWGKGSLGDVPVPNDYDGDGKTDFAVFRKSDGTWWIAKSSDGTSYALAFGITEDKPVPADYDGDGKADIAVFRPSTGDWHFWLSQTNQPGAVHFGQSGDKPVPADYDGDGKTDVGVFRPSTGTWYRLNSSDYTVSVLPYGIGTDVPIPGDYDGDGRANIAVFRDGVWYVLRDDFSTSILYWGIANDIPIFNDSAFRPTIGVYRASNSTFHLSYYNLGGSALTTGNSASETFVSSVLPPP